MKFIVKTTRLIVEHLRTVVPDCKVRRAYIGMMDAAKFTKLKMPLVSVYVVDKSAKISSRDSKSATLLIEIDVEKKISGTEDEEKLLADVDPLIDVVETIFDAFLKPVELGDDAFRITCKMPVHGEESPLYVSKILERNHFIGIVGIEAEISAKIGA